MQFQKPFNLLITVLLLSIKLNAQNSKIYKKYSFIEQKMGSDFGIIFFDGDSAHAYKIAQNAYLIVDSLNKSFSDYDKYSEISLLVQKPNEWVQISENLFQILKESKVAFGKSAGYFDVGLGQLTQLWRKSRLAKALPNKNELKFAQQHSGIKYIQIDKDKKQVKILKKGVLIDLGGIGKGFAAQKVLDYLKTENIHNALINAAGNMAIGAPPIDKKNWEIAVELPDTNHNISNNWLNINNMAISTSGDIYQFFVANGKKYSHILNPKTGLGLTNQRQVTIVCKKCQPSRLAFYSLLYFANKKSINFGKKRTGWHFNIRK